MNYKVMKRPMFKLGGKANSQGTGVTSGLDERVDLKEAGFLGTGMSQSDFGALTPQGLMELQAGMLTKGTGGMDDMRDIIRLQAISNLAGNVLPNIESGGLRAVTDFLRDPQTTQTAIKGLTGLKRVDLAQDKMNRENLSNLIKNQMQFKLGERDFEFGKEKFDFEKEKYEDLYGLKLDEIEIKRDQLNKETDRELRERYGREADELLGKYGSTKDMPPEIFSQYERKQKISLGQGFKTKAEAKVEALNAVSRFANPESIGFKKFNELVEQYAASIYFGKALEMAEGGRVNRAMGTPTMGEQPMNRGMGMTEQQDVAMETQGQGQNAYAMLRARLPQEVSDEVVKLIAYNKEAFADFASIKNQEDVSSFNEKYGVQLVIDVATV